MSDLLTRSRGRRYLRPALARALRQEAKVSQAEVGQELGVDESTVSKWESGDRRPRGLLADRYIKLLARLEDDLRRG
jgi:DNA-binding transcriptional regulator YiaG